MASSASAVSPAAFDFADGWSAGYAAKILKEDWAQKVVQKLSGMQAFIVDPFPSVEEVRNVINDYFAADAPGEKFTLPQRMYNDLQALDASQPRKVVPMYKAFLRALCVDVDAMPSNWWTWRRAYTVAAALNEVLQVDEIFRSCDFWDMVQSSVERARSHSPPPPPPSKKRQATVDPPAEASAGDGLPVFDISDEEVEDFDKEMQNFLSMVRPGALPEAPRLAKQPKVSASSASARDAGIAAVRAATHGSQLFNMGPAMRFEDWFGLDAAALKEWEQGMQTLFVDAPGMKLKQNAGAAIETKCLVMAVRLLMDTSVPIDTRLNAFGYHIFVRLVTLRLRAKAKSLPNPRSRALAMFRAEQFTKKALSATDQHPMLREIDLEIQKEAGNTAMAAGLAALSRSGVPFGQEEDLETLGGSGGFIGSGFRGGRSRGGRRSWGGHGGRLPFQSGFQQSPPFQHNRAFSPFGGVGVPGRPPASRGGRGAGRF